MTYQCQRIYESMVRSNKTKRVVNRINQQKQHRVAISNVIFSNVIFFSKIFVSVSFSRKTVFESKSRLFNFSSKTTFRLISKEALNFFKQKRWFKCRKVEHMPSTCESEFKSMSTYLKKIVKLFDSKN